LPGAGPLEERLADTDGFAGHKLAVRPVLGYRVPPA